MRHGALFASVGLAWVLALGCGLSDEGKGGDSSVETTTSTTSGGDGGLAIGEPCEAGACTEGAMCLTFPIGPRCTLECDRSEVYCEDDSLCIELVGVDYGACHAFGTTPAGGSCDVLLDCQPSLSCISDRGGPAVCVYTCDLGSDPVVTCPDGWDCGISTARVPYGVCKERYWSD